MRKLEMQITVTDLPKRDDQGRIICPFCSGPIPKYKRERAKHLKEIQRHFDAMLAEIDSEENK